MEARKFKPFRWVEHLLVAGMAAMSLMVFWNVVLRYGFNAGIPFSVEMSRLIFVWLIMLGSVVALREGMHICVDSVTRRLPRSGQVVCYFASHLVMLWCCWLVFQGSLAQTRINWSNHMPISGVSVGWMYAAGIAAAILWAAIILVNLLRGLRGDIGSATHLPAEVELHQDQAGGMGR